MPRWWENISKDFHNVTSAEQAGRLAAAHDAAIAGANESFNQLTRSLPPPPDQGSSGQRDPVVVQPRRPV